MSEYVKAVAIITNHFKEKPVNSKIVYVNNNLLQAIGYNLDELTGKDPEILFHNWYKDHFIEQIVACVDQKVSWAGSLDVNTKTGEKTNLEFVITPIYGIDGNINYYICSGNVLKCNDGVCTPELDDYISSMWQYYDHFVGVCKANPSNLIRIDLDGKIVYSTDYTSNQLGLSVNENFFESIFGGKQVKEEIVHRASIGKVTKLEFEAKIAKKHYEFQSKFWPIADNDHNIIGYAISFSDITERKSIKRQLLALKGV